MSFSPHEFPNLAPFESPQLRAVTGPALRPGGLELTGRALDLAGWAHGQRVLDLGCGLGASAGLLASRGLCVLGLDLSASLLGEARQAHSGLPLLRAEAAALPLATASLHGVLSECVLSLCPDPGAVLAECRRVLGPGGCLLLSDLYLRAPRPADDDAPLPGCLGGAMEKERLEALLRGAGLELAAWEDHSPLLRRLAAELAWAHGSAAALWGDCPDGACRELAARAAAFRPGYFLLMARRKD
ncbi:MAG: methyltransferase domain-containing protein [Desulfarculaceae bacterium]|nr:methyltransferase domain-containing protein [Desulfarculaceae bacterium]MCF8074526.1 methyltransferase domain-containing protein [Desulfarculaceae bacterium]MCF8103798.1 methyltransferase domain-containing protein [Desulfarculaceae bacterium]MCF8118140.1 methyltransferase domain-containing protein [Desulfarculaceae bacterium]